MRHLYVSVTETRLDCASCRLAVVLRLFKVHVYLSKGKHQYIQIHHIEACSSPFIVLYKFKRIGKEMDIVSMGVAMFT